MELQTPMSGGLEQPEQELHRDLMQWVLQGNDLIRNMSNFLEGVSPRIVENKLKMVRISHPLMNKKGISVTLMMMQAANKQALMSELDDSIIREVVGDFNDDYVDAMGVNTNKYSNFWGVEASMRSIIVTAAVNHLRMALLMAKGAGFRVALNKMESVSRQIIDAPNQRASIFGRGAR